MNRTRVKICGVTRVEDALRACALGADAIGLILVPSSPRCLTPAAARAIRDALPPFVAAVIVVADLPEAELRQAIAVVRPDLVQLHGNEPAALCEALGTRYVRAFNLANGGADAAVINRFAHAAGILLDGRDVARGAAGGGRLDWKRIPAGIRHPLILGGGLDAGNVGAAIRAVRPFAVDVSSGVEARPGVKDPARLRAFFRAVRDADRAPGVARPDVDAG